MWDGRIQLSALAPSRSASACISLKDSARSFSACTGVNSGPPSMHYCGWTKSCTTLNPWEMGNHSLLVFTGKSYFQGFLGGAGVRSSTVCPCIDTTFPVSLPPPPREYITRKGGGGSSDNCVPSLRSPWAHTSLAWHRSVAHSL